MEFIKSYILALMGLSFISTLVCSLLPETAGKKSVKFVCGIILAALIVSPLQGCETDYTDIFPESETYNLYSNTKAENLTREIISDKISEIIGKTFENYGIPEVKTEVRFGEDGEILTVKINATHEQAARDAAQILGIPYEIIKQTE